MDTRLLLPWDFLGKSTGVSCHFLLGGVERQTIKRQQASGQEFTTEKSAVQKIPDSPLADDGPSDWVVRENCLENTT